MAERRMLSKGLLSSDRFQELPLEHQALYFHLCLNADDDGFLANARSIARMLGLSPEALTDMSKAGYLILFDSCVTVIRHWRVHNAIRKDRYVPTMYQRELGSLTLDEEGVYRLADQQQKAVETNGCQTGNQMATQVSLGEVSKGQDRRESCEPTHAYNECPQIGSDRIQTSVNECSTDSHEDDAFDDRNRSFLDTYADCSAQSVHSSALTQEEVTDFAPAKIPASVITPPPTLEEVRSYARQKGSKVDPDRFYDYYSAQNWMRNSSPIVNWQAAFRCWENREKDFSSSRAIGKTKLLPIQQYSQRDYTGEEESLDEMMNRLMAG